jgi:MoaA/NifB/PqqE/SkfB family radical SAM enzyme
VISNRNPGPSRDERRNVEINVGKTCNSRCVFCLDGHPTREQARFMAWNTMKSELERWRGEGYLSVGFLGGEPSVYPHIVRAVAYASQLGYTRIALASNVMQLGRGDLADRLVEAGLTRVTVSMHAHTAKLEDRLTRVAGAFDRKIEAIARLKRHLAAGRLRDGLSINTVLNGYNYRYLPKMMKFVFVDLGLADFRINYVRPEGRAEQDAAVTPAYTAVMPVVAKAIVLNELHFKRVFTFGGIPLCVLPQELLRSRPLLERYAGDLYWDLHTDCSIRAEGYDDGVSQVEDGRARFNWQDRKRFDLKHQFAECRSCDAKEMCEGVWRNYLELYSGAEFASLRRERDRLERTRPRVARAPSARIQRDGTIRS